MGTSPPRNPVPVRSNYSTDQRKVAQDSQTERLSPEVCFEKKRKKHDREEGRGD